MGINFHPAQGTILICDFGMLKTPEIVKRRPVIVVSPNFKNRDNVCTVVPLSKSAPNRVMPYHHKLFFDPLLPAPYINEFSWVLGDMLYTVSFERLKQFFLEKGTNGKRIYDNRVLKKTDIDDVINCVKNGLGLI